MTAAAEWLARGLAAGWVPLLVVLAVLAALDLLGWFALDALRRHRTELATVELLEALGAVEDQLADHGRAQADIAQTLEQIQGLLEQAEGTHHV